MFAEAVAKVAQRKVTCPGFLAPEPGRHTFHVMLFQGRASL